MNGARLRRRWRVNVDVSAALNLVGSLIRYFSLAFLFPAVVALLHGETPVPFLAATAVTAGVGVGIGALTQGREHVGIREGFLVVSLTWLLGAAAVSLPYVFSAEVQLDRPIDALFEAMSGMTTGATVLVDYEAVDRSLMLWRQFSQWLGGMGIVVLALAVLPRLRVGGRQLMESETPGRTSTRWRRRSATPPVGSGSSTSPSPPFWRPSWRSSGGRGSTRAWTSTRRSPTRFPPCRRAASAPTRARPSSSRPLRSGCWRSSW